MEMSDLRLPAGEKLCHIRASPTPRGGGRVVGYSREP